MPPKTLLAFIPDLFFAVQVQDTASALGYRVELARDADAFGRELAQGQGLALALVLVDMGAPRTDWESLIRQAHAAGVPVVAFGDHTDLAGRRQALEAGAVTVVANSLVATNLARLLRRYAGRAPVTPAALPRQRGDDENR
ncbi:MAG: hypothetical protein HYY02_06880 [Chloroflexi bacterium]|nr:hypothetical protein [Chloroflexota bacterium]